MCEPRMTRHTSTQYLSCCHTRVTNVDAFVARTWVLYRCVPCHVWCPHRTSLVVKKNFFSFPVAVKTSIKVGPLVFLSKIFAITEKIMKRPVFGFYGCWLKCWFFRFRKSHTPFPNTRKLLRDSPRSFVMCGSCCLFPRRSPLVLFCIVFISPLVAGPMTT